MTSKLISACKLMVEMEGGALLTLHQHTLKRRLRRGHKRVNLLPGPVAELCREMMLGLVYLTRLEVSATEREA